MKGIPLKSLIQQVREGDAQATRLLYEQLSQTFKDTFRKRSESIGVDVQDLYHDMFIRLLEHVSDGRFDIERSDKINHWLFSCASNELNKKYNRYVQHPQRSGEFQRRLFLSSDAGDKRQSEAIIAELKTRIEAMGDPCRMLLLSYYFEGLSHREISEKFPNGDLDNASTFRVKRWRCLKGLGDVIMKLFN